MARQHQRLERRVGARPGGNQRRVITTSPGAQPPAISRSRTSAATSGVRLASPRTERMAISFIARSSAAACSAAVGTGTAAACAAGLTAPARTAVASKFRTGLVMVGIISLITRLLPPCACHGNHLCMGVWRWHLIRGCESPPSGAQDRQADRMPNIVNRVDCMRRTDRPRPANYAYL